MTVTEINCPISSEDMEKLRQRRRLPKWLHQLIEDGTRVPLLWHGYEATLTKEMAMRLRRFAQTHHFRRLAENLRQELNAKKSRGPKRK